MSATVIQRAGRRRRIAGWSLLALSAAIAAVWFASGWWTVTYGTANHHCILGGGAVMFVAPAPNVRGPRGWRIERVWEGGANPPVGMRRWWWKAPSDLSVDYNFFLLARYSYQFGTHTHITCWPIPLLFLAPAALLLRSGVVAHRRARTNHCIKCGYSLADLERDAVCPECGSGGGGTK